MNQSPIYEQSITGRMSFKHNWDTNFSPEVHVFAGMLRPRCVDQHLVVRRLRGVARTSSSLGHRKNRSTSEITQWHEQSTRVAFGTPLGNKPKNPSQISPWLGVDTITKSPRQSTNPQPSRWRQSPRVIRNLQLQSPPSATRLKSQKHNTRVSPNPLTNEHQAMEKERRGRRCSWSSQICHLSSISHLNGAQILGSERGGRESFLYSLEEPMKVKKCVLFELPRQKRRKRVLIVWHRKFWCLGPELPVQPDLTVEPRSKQIWPLWETRTHQKFHQNFQLETGSESWHARPFAKTLMRTSFHGLKLLVMDRNFWSRTGTSVRHRKCFLKRERTSHSPTGTSCQADRNFHSGTGSSTGTSGPAFSTPSQNLLGC